MATAAIGHDDKKNGLQLEFEDAKQLQADLDKALTDQQLSASIITFGRPGSGKTELVHTITNDQKFVGKSGMKPGTLKKSQATIHVDNIQLQVVDTRGMKDAIASDDDKETIETISKIICLNDGTSTNGVLIVCIEMHERVDETTMETLALLHRTFGKVVWYHVVIALTKADRYQESKWEQPKWYKSTRTWCKENFAIVLSKCKADLKSYFTESAEKCKEKCCIGMTSEQYDELDIPVVPTSELTGDGMRRMKRVGHEYWLEELIVSCCQREKGIVLLRLHKDRLNNLPTSLVKELEKDYLVKGTTSKEFRKLSISKLWYILGPKFYWNRYCKVVSSVPRFEQNPATAEDHEQKQLPK